MSARMEKLAQLREAVLALAKELGIGITDIDVFEESEEMIVDVRFRVDGQEHRLR